MKILERFSRFLGERKIKKLMEIVCEVNALEDRFSRLSDADLKKYSEKLREEVRSGGNLDDLLVEAYALVREVGKRTIGLRMFDVQIMGGIVLHQGKVAEMKTGEGKTLVATLPVYLNALTGKGVHVVTVNDYLAKRDVQWMGPIYNFLGLSVGVLQQDATFLYEPGFNADNERLKNLKPVSRKEAYMADVTYGTNSEFGFDYLRDNMVYDPNDIVQRGHHFAIIDEVDSILIDEARTPLIISGPSERSASLYKTFARLVPLLKEEVDFKIDYKSRSVVLTEKGVEKVEKMLKVDNLYDIRNKHLVDHLIPALKAQFMFKKDVDYIVKDGEVIIVDEFTGRLMPGRRYSEGLHQAIEAKEGVAVREESQTWATITLQNYFRKYGKLAGMTGTAATEAEEFMHIYGLEVVVIPPNKPVIRKDFPDVIYKTEKAKYQAVVDEIARLHKKGQPVLVGTVSIEKNEMLSEMLKKRGIPHQVLNAKHHEREASIIAQAGRLGAVTVATNMAGRGVDIILGGNPPIPSEAKKVVELGGLHVIGTERHEARRIDNQLRGRSGRQGDPGSSRFYLSLEDELLKTMGSERVKSLMDRLDLPDNEPLEHPLIARTIEMAQKQIESQNFAIRKHLLEYDDVLNKQREAVYALRRSFLTEDNLEGKVLKLIESWVEETVDYYFKVLHSDSEVNEETLRSEVVNVFGQEFSSLANLKEKSPVELKEAIFEEAKNLFYRKRKDMGPKTMDEIARFFYLQVIDYHWREFLVSMDYFREGIYLRSMAQRDPLVEYKTEGFQLFQEMISNVREDFLRYLFHAEVRVQAEKIVQLAASAGGRETTSRSATPAVSRKVGRNDPCPCGSGKKYKKCCGKPN